MDRARRLAGIVAGEAMKGLVDRLGAVSEERVAAGWERRFVGDAARAREAVELYRQLGYEVVADTVEPAHLPDGCKDCALVAALGFKVIYTRGRSADGDEDAQP